MTNDLTNKSDHWASIRERPRRDGTIAYGVLHRLDGRQSVLTFDDPQKAAAMVALIKAHGSKRALEMHGIRQAPRHSNTETTLTVGAYINQHIDSLSGVEKKTLSEYQRYLIRDIKPTLGDIPLTALDRADLSTWVNRLRDGGASGKTIRNKIGFLSGALNLAVPKLIAANPATGIRLPRTPKRQMTILTTGEYQLLKSAFTDHWHPLLDFLVTSGCRFSEATMLHPPDIDRESGTARIWRAWKKTPGSYEAGAPKSERGNRTVNVPAWVIDNMDLGGEYVFTNTHGGPIRLYSWRANVWYKSLTKARTQDPNDPDKPYLMKSPRIHDLRHSCASWWLSRGVPLITVSALLGHEDVSTTSRVYAHLIPGAGKAASDAMTFLFDPATPHAL